MVSSSKQNPNATLPFPSPTSTPLQHSTLMRVIKIEDQVQDTLQTLTEIQMVQLRMEKEQEKQGKILRNLQKFLMDNQANPIVIDDESSNVHIQQPLENDNVEEEEEEEEPMEEAPMEDDEQVVCVGEVYFDKDGNLVEQNGNFCLHYPYCPIHKSPIVKKNH